MAQIQRVILFVSTGSYQCKQSLSMVSASSAPIEVVRLDTVQSRLAASRGKLFQVINVPSLVTIFTDGKLQLFVGNDRVVPVLNSLTSPPQQQHGGNEMTSTPISDPEMYDEPQAHAVSRPQSRKSGKTRKSGKSRKSNGKSRKSGKRRSPPPDDNSDVEVIEELEFEDEPDIAYRPPPPPTAGLLVGANARRADTGNKNIMEIAKRMAKQREATLGYSEKDLPKGGF